MAHHASSQAHGKEEDEMLQQLVTMSSRERVRAFRNHFIRTVEALHSLERPPQCESYPAHFTDDIIDAYLKFTTFAVPVRVNYDAACKKFYTDRRAQDCGKLVLTPKVEQKLERTIGHDRLPLGRVRFEIGTPFQLLCNVTVTVADKEGGGKEIRTRCKMATVEEHPHLCDFLQDVCTDFEDCTIPDDCEGLELANIRHLALAFNRRPNEQELRVKHSLFHGHLSVWMVLHRDKENEGWTDFEALGKQCNPLFASHCRGCYSEIRRVPSTSFTIMD